MDGQIFSKNPDNDLIGKMIAVAGMLDAVVQGDEGEIYDSGYLDSEESLSVWEKIKRYFKR
ncbi:MAG: hypothetical protein ACK2UP_20240 [Candidatus Promineifilaceae bacterium]